MDHVPALLRIERGDPTAEELAAVTAVVLAAARRAPAADVIALPVPWRRRRLAFGESPVAWATLDAAAGW